MTDLRAKYSAIKRKSLVMMVATLVAYAAIISVCWLWFRMKGTEVVAVGTVLFQFGVIGWGLGYIFRYFEATMVRMDMSLELAEKTVEMIDSIKEEVIPVVRDARTIIHDVRESIKDVSEIVHEVKERDLGTVRDALSRLQAELDGQGKLHRIDVSLAKIADSVGDGMENRLLERIDRAVGDALGGE
jgi:hypothetical protein